MAGGISQLVNLLLEKVGLMQRTRGCSSDHLLPRKVDVRLPGKGNSNSRGARPVHLIITMIKWTRTSRSSIKNSLFLPRQAEIAARDWNIQEQQKLLLQKATTTLNPKP